MVKVTWKVIKGYGPYAYLQDTVKSGGVVSSKHLAYLGKAGLGKDGVALIPGKHFTAPAAGDFPGGRIFVPTLGAKIGDLLKPKPKALVDFMEAAAEEGVPTKSIIDSLKVLQAKKTPSKKGQGKKATSTSEVAPNQPAAPPPAGQQTQPGAKTKSSDVPEDAAKKEDSTKSFIATLGVLQAKKAAGEKAVQKKATPTPEVAPNQPPAPPAGQLGAKPKVSDVPKDNKGKSLITPFNVKKLEAAAAAGLEELQATAKTLSDKMLHAPKKAAIANAAAELQGQLQGAAVNEGDGGSGLAETLNQVKAGKVELPKQEVPPRKVMFQQEKAQKSNTKDYDADLEQVSGKKGSNEGGLFKDKHLETLHYVKWPNGGTRAKVEALTALLYAHAKVPVPTLRVIKFQGKDAVMSDWIEDAAPMTMTEIGKHKDVRTGYAVDAWLANWDVVGLQSDNVVKGPGGKAYRIDVGGSMLFRAQGKAKAFPADVPELENMRDPAIAPQAAKAFAKLTPTQLKTSAKKVADVTDAQIDAAVDSVQLPKKSADYPASQFGTEASDLPAMLKARLKARRDWLVDQVLKAEEKKAATLAALQQDTDLKATSLKAIIDKAGEYTASKPAASSKWALAGRVMRTELGKDKGEDASEQTKAHYGSWKGSSTTGKGSVLRWAAGAMSGEGRKELRRLERFNDFLVEEKHMTTQTAKEHAAHLQKATAGDAAADLVEGLRVTNKENDVVHQLQNPGKEKVTLYRGWKTPQVKYLKVQDAKVGDVLTLEDPPLYSWSLTPNVAHGFGGGHGSFVTRAEVPIDKVLLSDIVNSTGSYSHENEVLFKGVKNLKMEVIKKV